MLLASLFSSFYLLTTPAPSVKAEESPALIQDVQVQNEEELTQAIQVVRAHHLETQEGRLVFLTEKLSPFVSSADTLNHEIQILAVQISSFEEMENPSLETKQQMVDLGEELNQKMALMIDMLPNLQTALLIEEDLNQIDAILAKEESLAQNEKELLYRLSSLCTYLDAQERGI